MFAVMSSMVRLSARGNEAVQGFAQTIRGRIEALGRAHDYVRPLGSSKEEASHPERSLHDLMRAILEPYLDDGSGERVHISGADARIDSAAATAFALAIHEFATNAVKYGALSSPGGKVEIACRVQGGMLKVTWSERGGPPIDEAPKREGFGTTVVRRSFAGELGGTIKTEWGQHGLTIRLSAPLDRLGART
jgi:two-component sensor histidine kinase